MHLKNSLPFKEYVYAFSLAAANFLLSILLTIFVSRYLVSEWGVISFDYLLLTVVLLNLLFVLLQWYYLARDKAFKKSNITLNPFFTAGLYFGVILLTILYQFYYGNTPTIGENIAKQIPLLLSTIVIVPIIEEFVYREIIVKTLSSKIELNFADFIYLSFLFTLIHIELNPINWLYLGYIFVIGILLLLIRIKHGLAASILTHIVINGIAWLMF